MKAEIRKIASNGQSFLVETIEADELEIGNGSFYFYNIDRTEPALPIQSLVAAFPINEFYVLRIKE